MEVDMPERRISIAFPLMAMFFLFLGCQSTAPSFDAPSSASASSASASALETQLYRAMNRTRSDNGVAPWVRSEALASLARAHSERMASGSIGFDHSDFDARADSGMKATGSYRAAENLARSLDADAAIPDITMESWLTDRPHRNNLLGDFRFAGIGVARSPSGEVFATLLLTGL